MKKTVSLLLCALLICFAFTSCRNSYIPIWMLPGYGDDEPSISAEEAAALTASYIDEINLSNTTVIAKEAAGNYANKALEEINALDSSLISNVLGAAARIMLGSSQEGDVELLVSSYEKILDSRVLTSVEGASASGIVLKLSSYNLPASSEIPEILDALVDGTGDKQINVPASLTFAVSADKMTSAIFHTGSDYQYEGTLYLTVDGAIINDERSDFYIDFTKVTAYTENPLTATTGTGTNQEISFKDITATLDARINLMSSSPYVELDFKGFTPVAEKGTVVVDGREVPFSMILLLTENA